MLHKVSRLEVQLLIGEKTQVLAAVEDGRLAENSSDLGRANVYALTKSLADRVGLIREITDLDENELLQLAWQQENGWSLRIATFRADGALLTSTWTGGEGGIDTNIDAASVAEVLNILAQSELFHFPINFQLK